MEKKRGIRYKKWANWDGSVAKAPKATRRGVCTFKDRSFQCLTDILAILCQVAFQIAPGIPTVVSFLSPLSFSHFQVAKFYWRLRASSLPAWTYIHMYFFLLARSIGVVLICGHRFLSIKYTYSYANMLLNSIPGICIILFHFTLSVLAPLPIIYYQKGFEFANEQLDYKMTEEMLMVKN